MLSTGRPMRSRLKTLQSWFYHAENSLAIFCLLLVALIPSIEIVVRKWFSTGITGATQYVQHLVIWVTFLGGAIASRGGDHLALHIGIERLPARAKKVAGVLTAAVGVAVCATLAWSSWQFIILAFDADRKIGILPVQPLMWIMPFGYGVVGLRFIVNAPPGWWSKVIAFLGIGAAVLLGFVLPDAFTVLAWPLTILLVVAGLFGAPIFVVLGGVAAVLFVKSGGTTVSIPNEAYVMLTKEMIPTIPLFTLAGFILSESKAGERLIRLFKAWFGWLPGGLSIVAIVICTFFTALTGASGVTILALGGLLSYVLIQSHYDEDFVTGLLTVNGIGSLFPPSLPIIMFGVLAQISIQKIFAAVLVPCAVMVLFLVAYSVSVALKRKIKRIPFDFNEALVASRGALGEILLPVVILGTFFSGLTTLVETGAFAVLYVLVVEGLVHRDLSFKQAREAFLKSIPIMGGVLVILATARGLSYYIVDAEIPMKLTEWMGHYVHSKYVFLILLNLALLVAGCLMDIFSALIVLVPLVLPLARAYGVDPIHLGVIFLANLEVGFLTPPVGINLFFASYRFNIPLARVYKTVLPFLVVMLISVLLITYIPALTTIPAGWVH